MTYASPTVVSDRAYDGTYSMYINLEHEYVRDDLATPVTTLVIQWYINWGTLPSTGVYCQPILIRNATYAGIFQMSTAAANDWFISYRNGAGYSYASPSHTRAVDTWYNMTLKIVLDNSAGSYQLWINGASVWSVSGLDNDYDTSIKYIYLGNSYGGTDATDYWIDYYRSDDSGFEGEEPQNVIADLSETVTVTDSFYTQKSLYRYSAETTGVTSSAATTKTLYRTSGSSFTVETTQETQKDLGAMFIEQLETVTITAGLYTTKHIAATLIELTETLTIIAQLYTSLLVELTTSDLLGLIIVFSVIALAIALCALGLHFKKK